MTFTVTQLQTYGWTGSIPNNYASAVQAAFILPVGLGWVEGPNAFIAQYDDGVEIIATVFNTETGAPQNVSGAASVLKVGYPDGTSLDAVASVYSGGADGRLVYTCGPNDFLQWGSHSLQAKLSLFGATYSTRQVNFWVKRSEDPN